jgi:hypothetical protein
VDEKQHHSHLASLAEAGNEAGDVVRTATDLRATAFALYNTLVSVTALARVLATVRDTACITIVGVNAAEDSAIFGNNVIEDNIAGSSVRRAITATANDLAVVLSIEILDGNCTTAIELENLV